ncbi:3988_t:CDS:2, partial [Acaulospora colombiana]
AETLRLGLIREEGRLKSWARSWGIPIEAAANSLYAKEAVGTKLLIDEAEDACIDLVEIEATLKNMWELLSQGKAIQEAQLGQSYKDHNDGLDRIRPRSAPYSLRSTKAAVACEV